MTARILTTATMAAALAGALSAADMQLLNMVMPDAKVLAGVNVDQAKNTPFGQYVLSQVQMQDKGMQELIQETGFDPTRDVSEVLVASNGAPNNGLALARGNFNVTAISSVATRHEGVMETYGGATILEDPKKTHGIAFLGTNLVVAGALADVKAALDRQKVPTPLPSSVTVQVNQWSGSQDAWALTTVPPATLHPGSGTPSIPGLGVNGGASFQSIQSAAGGVKFGNSIVMTAQAQADTAQNAQQLAGVLQFLASVAQAQTANQEPQAAALLSALKISSQGSVLNVNLTVTEDQAQQIIQLGPHPGNEAPRARKPVIRK